MVKINYATIMVMMMPFCVMGMFPAQDRVYVNIEDELSKQGTADEITTRSNLFRHSTNELLSQQGQFTRLQEEFKTNFSRINDIFKAVNPPEGHADRQTINEFTRILDVFVNDIASATERTQGVGCVRAFLLSAQELQREQNFPEDFQAQLQEVIAMFEAGQLERR